MDASELAAKMLQWEEVKRSLDALTEEIQAAVLAIGKTQTVGNVRASRAFAPRNTDPGDVGERLASLDSWLLNHEERIARLEREREHRR